MWFLGPGSLQDLHDWPGWITDAVLRRHGQARSGVESGVLSSHFATGAFESEDHRQAVGVKTGESGSCERTRLRRPPIINRGATAARPGPYALLAFGFQTASFNSVAIGSISEFPMILYLRGSRAGGGPHAFGFPRMTQFLAALEHIFLGLVEIRIHARAFDHVARAATSHQVARILLAFAGARHHEINGHDQNVLEAGPSVQSAVLAAELIAFQDFHSFRRAYGPVHQRQGHKIQWHGTPPNRKSSCRKAFYGFLRANHTAAFGACQDRAVWLALSTEAAVCGTFPESWSERSSCGERFAAH